ncbi:hypothetical protein J2S43_006969 [Catenuloplanes nepalensis]|uniref:PASTA domain-containing protein n=1 Tax=Catenuloplanes nepalensis TaxID=587533 RepID=A0ABT9N456_9ACTN|nr:PASTA domain-containing protein [Catenuloplanes nepalensis]MDP9798457.1 hypothetical protein [Catenuloplanes nepalensis]
MADGRRPGDDQGPSDETRQWRGDDARYWGGDDHTSARPPADPWAANEETRLQRPTGGPPGPAQGGPPRGPQQGGPPRGGDQTAPYRPVPGGPDQTAPYRPVAGGPGGNDQTRPYRPVPGGPDQTAPYRPVPGGDATRRMDPVQGGPAGPAGPAGQDPWTARASVRPSEPAGAFTQSDPFSRNDPGWGEPEEPNRKWLMPVMWGVITLLVILLLGVGIYFGTQAGGGDPEPTPSVTTAATPTAERTSAEPSEEASEEPTPEETTAAPSPTRAAEVEVPRMTGYTMQEAQQELAGLGLPFALVYQTTDDFDPNTVIDSDPPGGAVVPKGTKITLTVARAPEPTAPAEPTGGPTTEPGPNG